ncbi:hypothetical protein [Paenibacillus pabuli]
MFEIFRTEVRNRTAAIKRTGRYADKRRTERYMPRRASISLA